MIFTTPSMVRRGTREKYESQVGGGSFEPQVGGSLAVDGIVAPFPPLTVACSPVVPFSGVVARSAVAVSFSSLAGARCAASSVCVSVSGADGGVCT